MLQDTTNEDVWGTWGVTWRDVQIVDAEGELTDVLSLTTNDIRDQANYDNLRSMIVSAATSNRVQQSDWQNAVEPLDVNADNSVAPIDALRIINKINSDGAGELPAASGEPANYYDVTGDGFVSSLDALRVIQILNKFSSGSGEPAEAPVQAGAADAFFALQLTDADDSDDDEAI